MAALWLEAPIIPLSLALYGAGIGLESIARGTLPLAIFGPERYAADYGPDRHAEPHCSGYGLLPSIKITDVLLDLVGGVIVRL